MDNGFLKEYETLRSEIMQKISLCNTLLTFTITTTVAILTVAASEDKPFLYLIPFCVIIPMAMRIAYYRKTIAKLSGYIIVFLERDCADLKWETRNVQLIRYFNTSGFNYYEWLILGIVCYILFLISYVPGNAFSGIVVFHVLWPLLPLIWLCIITKYINKVDMGREAWIRNWTEIKAWENRSQEC